MSRTANIKDFTKLDPGLGRPSLARAGLGRLSPAWPAPARAGPDQVGLARPRTSRRGLGLARMDSLALSEDYGVPEVRGRCRASTIASMPSYARIDPLARSFAR